MSRQDSIDALFLKKPVATVSSASKSADRVRTGAISAIGSSLYEMAENAKQATKFQRPLAEGGAVIAIDLYVGDRRPNHNPCRSCIRCISREYHRTRTVDPDPREAREGGFGKDGPALQGFQELNGNGEEQ
ncbi:hypothetical protein [Sinorhizobium meliloti]|uniref:hypothetical protein n=1 Tax=Rhizobium meliloti TaxID=382 RepID=UPI001E5A33F1|nr:hypothetical protein [Sinorhizobium meliloti]UFX13024.1 hypothetical protein SmelRRI128_33285 [Sinorhizobium meliloti]